MRQKGKVWKDHAGKDVPTYAINPVLRIEDQFSNQIAEAARRVEKDLIKLVGLTRAAHTRVYEAKLIDAKIKEHKKVPSDGMTINSFDQTVQVKMTKPDTMYFDNTYTKMVKDKFDEYFALFSGDSEELQIMRNIVSSLLYTSGGNLDNNKVLQLRKFREDIKKSPKMSRKGQVFCDAIDLFDKAVKVKPGNMGIYIDIRDEHGKMRRVPIKYTDI